MGQKVNPLGFRLGVSQKHISHWFIDNHHYSQLVVEDQFIRNFFSKRFPGIAEINIKRDLNRIVIEILSANTRDLLIEGDQLTGKATGTAEKAQSSSSSNISSIDSLCNQLLKELTIYRQNQLPNSGFCKIEDFATNKVVTLERSSELRSDKQSFVQTKNVASVDSSLAAAGTSDETDSTGLTELNPDEPGIIKKPMEVELFLTRVENPNTSAACLAEFIVEQLEKRVPFRRVLKRSIQKAEEASVQGIKVQISGRLNGAEIARSERIHKGQVPLHTLRAKIEYNSRTAKTIYGLLGVKVWVFNGFADLTK